MGNVLRRSNSATTSDPQAKKNGSTTVASALKGLKLAPQIQDEDYGSECPICFLAIKEMNEAVCCKGLLCTDCFLNIVAAHSKGPLICPFCNTDSFTVKYPPTTQSKFSPGNEGEEKVRNTPDKLADILIHKSTVGDRMQVEAEIRSQRSIAGSKNYAVSPTSGSRTNAYSAGRGAPTRQPLSASVSSGFTSRMQSGSEMGQNLDMLAFGRLHNILSGSSSQNTDDIEELMLLEAIRLSLEVEASPADSSVSRSGQEGICMSDASSVKISDEKVSGGGSTLLEEISLALSTPPGSPKKQNESDYSK